MRPDAPALSFTLPPSLTVETADALVLALTQQTFQPGQAVVLDAAPVRLVSAAGAQVLVALEKSVAEAAGQLSIAGQKDFLTGTFRNLGLHGLVDTLR